MLMKRLKEKWPNVEVRHVGDSRQENYAYEWRIRKSGKVLEGQFDGGESAVSLDGDVKDALEFALWFRSIVPREQDLLLYDEGFTMRIALKPEATERDLTAAIQNV